MNTRGLANKDFHLEALDVNNNVFYSPKSLYLTLQTKICIGNNKSYALSNINDEDATEGEFNFVINSDVFGIDNYVTHHICSEHRLFIKSTYKEIEKLGVRGIPGSVIAKGIGTIKLTITDNSGKKTMKKH